MRLVFHFVDDLNEGLTQYCTEKLKYIELYRDNLTLGSHFAVNFSSPFSYNRAFHTPISVEIVDILKCLGPFLQY